MPLRDLFSCRAVALLTRLCFSTGFQVPWRTVFVYEYLGPLIFHPLILPLGQYIYFGFDRQLNTTQWLSFALVMLHFTKRELETMFVHRFSASTMPLKNVFWNSLFYWFPAGLLAAYEIYSPWALAARQEVPAMNALGVALYIFGQCMNARVHLYLASLRKPGETTRTIPVGYGFNLVTCVNYMYEIIAWAGIILITRSVFLVIFISIGMLWMWRWGWEKEYAYRKQFGDKYKKKRYVMLPGLL
jgi:very-long-chain enoyl-CoA reductase